MSGDELFLTRFVEQRSHKNTNRFDHLTHREAAEKWTHLVEEQLPPLLLPQVHLLHRHLLAAVLLAGDAHDARGALADLDEVVQVFPRVT